MKKMILLFASLVLMVLLAACGTPTDAKAPETALEVTAVPKQLEPQATEVPVATLWFNANGEQQADGGWKLTYIEYKDASGVVLIKAEASTNAVTMYMDPLPDGTFQNSETQLLNDHEMFTVLVNVDGYDIPGGAIFNYEGTIYWYPPMVIPWFFNEPAPKAPEQNG
jgi:hypothetical protein